MNNLKLVTTEMFENSVSCDFWKDVNDEYFITRKQIGTALGYNEPSKSIDKIHNRHKDRFDKFSTTVILGMVEGDRYVERERILYSRKGVMEICRWSRQPLADKFMDWCWDVINNILFEKNDNSMIIANQNLQIEEMNSTIKYLATQNNQLEKKLDRLESMISTLLPPTNKSEWKTEISKKIKSLAGQMGLDTQEGIRSIYGDIYKIMRNDYDMAVDRFKSDYLIEHKDITNPPAIDIVSATPELKGLFENIVDNYISIKAQTV